MNQAYTPQRLEEGLSPSQIGAQMAKLRVGFNLTPQEVSERLHIRARYINAIEEGKLELLPGKVYARGYIHTYAEFLGLDAEHVATQCFAAPAGPETMKEKPKAVPSAPKKPMTVAAQSTSSNWRGYGIVASVALLTIVGFSQIFGGEETTAVEEPNVAPVPEAMLQTVRTMLMPTPDNNGCLSEDLALGCLYVDESARLLQRIEALEPRFVGQINLTDVMPVLEAPAEEAKATNDAPVEDATAEEKSEEPND